MRFVVFPNDVEYQAHMSSIHGVHNRLQFNFQVARNGGNPVSGPLTPGYADEVPDHWNYGVSDHPPSPPVQLEEAFPALPTPAGPAPPPVLRPAIARLSSAHSQGAPPARLSESFGEDPRRRISFFKRDDARVPSVTLSAHITNLNKQARAAQASSRLKFLPLRSSTPLPHAAPVPARPPVPVNRGWEHIEPRRAPVVADAWSDEEGEGDDDGELEEEGTAESQEQSDDSEDKPLVEQNAVAQVAEKDEDSAETKALKAKVAAIKIEEEEWE
ncbi:unnamed protein product [Phytophthora lilii]|uniref:Unnamed protein product n=1 Tax=Phytophthora lilii TaxID=2077276 RepID=A0A9W6U0G5_9STRA|nr:unnamed protein product [Phytophthora lilii]